MLDLLDAVWGDNWAFGELRCIRKGEVKQTFYAYDLNEYDLEGLCARAKKHDDDGWDVYYGVLPRIRASGKADDCAPTTKVLWADIDSKHLDGTKLAALLALGRTAIPPSIVVDSGNGIHAYWLLRDAVPFVEAARVMRGLAQAIGGDAVYDAPRVLRLPGTHNHKTNPPHPVRMLHFEPDRKVRFSDFSDYIADERERAVNELAVALRHDAAGLAERMTDYSHIEAREISDLPDWLQELLEQPTPQGYRSGAIFKAVMWLYRFGWSLAGITAVLYMYPEGIGAKVAEMKPARAEYWIKHTYDKAVEAALTDD